MPAGIKYLEDSSKQKKENLMRNETTRARVTYQSIISPGRSTVSCSNYTKNAPILSLYQRTIPLEITATCLCSTRVSRDFIDFICAAKKKTVLSQFVWAQLGEWSESV